MANNTEDVELTVGVDMGIPGGCNTAISIKQGDTLYTFEGAEARVIIHLIQQEASRRVAEALENIKGESDLDDSYEIPRLIVPKPYIEFLESKLQAERKQLEGEK